MSEWMCDACNRSDHSGCAGSGCHCWCQRDEKGTCCVCGHPAPGSVVCDDCSFKNFVRLFMDALTRNRENQ